MRTIASVSWTDLSPGLRYLKVTEPVYGIDLYAWQFALSTYKLILREQDNESGQSVEWFRRHVDRAIFAVNAGRIDWLDGKHLTAAGLLVVDGKRKHDPWPQDRGGVLEIWDNTVKIVPGRPRDDLNSPYAIQGTPVMIEPGGKWSMRQNDHDGQSRVAVCLPKSGEVIVVVASGKGLSLWDLASVLKPGNPGQKLNCDSAISLDGGPGTQVSFDSLEKLDLRGRWPVHDALVVIQR